MRARKFTRLKYIIDAFASFVGFLIFSYLFISFTSIIDAFPWGNSRAAGPFMEPVMLYYLVPLLFTAAILSLIFYFKDKNYSSAIMYGLLCVALYIPSHFGFKEAHEVTGRWVGLFVTLIAALVLITNVISKIGLVNEVNRELES